MIKKNVMEKIGIVGATSFISSALVESLKEYKIVATYVHEERTKKINHKSNINWIKYDLSDGNLSNNMIGELANCTTIYLAAWMGTHDINNEKMNEKSHEALLNLVLKLISVKNNIQRIIYFGTQAEYGSINGHIIESSLCNPCCAYGIAKYRLGMEIREICSENNIYFYHFRIHSVYGVGRGGILEKVIEDLLKTKECYLSTNCQQFWNYLYIDDCINYFLLPLNSNIPSGIYNIGYDLGLRLKDYFEIIRKIIGKECKIFYGDNGDDTWKYNSRYSTKKIDKYMDREKIPFNVGINSVIDDIYAKVIS